MIYPPRPEVMVSHDQLYKYDNGTYYAQAKLNGSCCILQLTETNFQLWSRHNDLLSNCKDLGFQNLYSGTGEMLLVGEYMNKSKMGVNGSFNHKFCIFDILKYNGRHLYGSTFQERQDMLNGLYSGMDFWVNNAGELETEPFLHRISEDIYRMRNFGDKFTELWLDVVKYDAYEGLVLKKRDAQLQPGYSQKNNTSWQLKCRKPTKIYKF